MNANSCAFHKPGRFSSASRQHRRCTWRRRSRRLDSPHRRDVDAGLFELANKRQRTNAGVADGIATITSVYVELLEAYELHGATCSRL